MRRAFGLLLALTACATEAPQVTPPACPDDLPGACPSPAPRWTGQVDAIVAAKCTSCHQPGAQAPSPTFHTYTLAVAAAQRIEMQVYGCRMPLGTAPQLTTDERAAILGWVVCGMPE